MSLSVRDTSGNILIPSDVLFSGAVVIGSGVYSGVVRLYNNYDGDPDVPHVRDVKFYMSPASGTRNIPLDLGDPKRDVRTAAMVYDTLSGVCTFSSKLGADPSASLQNMNTGIYDTDYDEISASGVNNYNEYRIEMSIPSGTNLSVTSGTVYFHVEYRTWLP